MIVHTRLSLNNNSPSFWVCLDHVYFETFNLMLCLWVSA